MNTYLKIQVQNMIQALNTFETGCKMAVIQDDGVMDRKEEKILKQIQKASDDFRKTLNSVIKE